MNHRQTLGAQGEDIACAFLTQAGYLVVERNWRCARGEIDIVTRFGDDLVFVEVKTRTSLRAGHPFEAITPVKVTRLKHLALEWCRQNRPGAQNIRLDAVAVLIPPQLPATVEHLIGIGQ